MLDILKLGRTIADSLAVKNVGRIGDLPYWTSPPIQYVYESTASLSVGSYVWEDAPSVLTPVRPILDNAVYLLESISLTADVDKGDFESAITTPPKFNTYLESNSNAIMFREPIIMNTYYDQFQYRMLYEGNRGSDQLLAGFTGVLVQSPALVGKTSITLKAVLSVQEIIDDNYINLVKAQFPKQPDTVREAS